MNHSKNQSVPYGAKVEAILKALRAGQEFVLHTYLGEQKLQGISPSGSWAVTGEDFGRRSWAICSTVVDRWYSEIK